jgi:hypothetical protein
MYPSWYWSKLTTFQQRTKRRIVIISYEDHEAWLYTYHHWPTKEIKKGINFSCVCALLDHNLGPRMELQIFNWCYFVIIHQDKDYIYASQVADHTYSPLSLQFQCIAKIIIFNLVKKANDYLPIGLRKILNEFTGTKKLPFTRVLGRHGDRLYRCRKKDHKFELIRNYEKEIWNEQTYDLTAGFQWLGF